MAREIKKIEQSYENASAAPVVGQDQTISLIPKADDLTY